MPNVRDHDASVYLRLQGDALSVGGYEQNPIFWEEVSEKFKSFSGLCNFNGLLSIFSIFSEKQNIELQTLKP